jgi:kynurenine 3-monooxygenase
MNAAFEDCLLLSDQLRQQSSQAQALSKFYLARKPDTEAIAALSLRNFDELCSEVGSPAFRLEKLRATRTSQGSSPTLYEMISFSTIPYGEALKRAGGLP